MEAKPKRVPGSTYSSELGLVLRKREYIVDVDKHYEALGLDPNKKNWGKHEIKEQFRRMLRSTEDPRRLIEAYKVLSSTQRAEYDLLTKSIERLLEEVIQGRRVAKKTEKTVDPQNYAYFVDEQTKEDYELAKQWMSNVATYYYRRGISKSVRVVLSDHFEQVIYPWGELIYVDTHYKPDLEVLVYHLMKDSSDMWYLDFCKIVRSYDEQDSKI